RIGSGPRTWRGPTRAPWSSTSWKSAPGLPFSRRPTAGTTRMAGAACPVRAAASPLAGEASTMNLVSAVFETRRDAEQAIDWLRSRGVPNDGISVLARDGSIAPAHRTAAEGVHTDPRSDLARGAGTGLVAGPGVGALLGLAA